MLAAGLPMAAVSRYRLTTRERRVLAALAVAGAAVCVWLALASVASMAAMPMAGLDRKMVVAVLEATPLGVALHVRVGALAAFLLALLLTDRPAVVALPGMVALASVALTGHAGAEEGAVGLGLQISDAVHVLAAALWFGTLIRFLTAALRRAGHPPLLGDLARFARTGTGIVAILAISGSWNALAITRHGWSATSGWSIWLGVKLVFFLAALTLAALNRWRFTPALERGEGGARERLVLSLLAEIGCLVAIIVIVARFGLLNPAG